MLSDEEKSYLQVSPEEMEPVKSFFLNAIQAKSSGDAYLYTHLVQQLRARDDPDTLFRVYLAMSSFVTRITAKPQLYRELIQSLYTFDWHMEDRVVVAFIHLLGQVVSSNPIFLLPSLQMLVKSFLPSQAVVDEFTAITDETAKQVWLYQHQQKQSRLHRAVQSIVHIAPTAQLELFSICQSHFPHKRHHVLIQTEYISQLLTLCVHFPSLQLKLFDLVVSKCLEVDVEIVIEESGEVVICKDDEAAGLFDEADEDDMFALDDNPGQGQGQGRGSACPKGGLGAAPKIQLQVRDDVMEMADKLDCMLNVLLKFLLQHLALSSQHAPVLQDRIFSQFFQIFESRVLSTYKSKFVQYIIFVLCKNYPQRGISFVQRLLELFTDTKNHHLCRQSSVLYLASFLARANFIPQTVTSDMVSLLMAWCASYVAHDGNESSMMLTSSTHQGQGQGQRQGDDSADTYVDYSDRYVSDTARRVTVDDQNLHKHETFYCAVQTCCYLVCYHGVTLGAHIRDRPAERQHWEVVMGSKYQPAKFCLQSVRVEFLRLAREINMFPAVDNVASVPSDKSFEQPGRASTSNSSSSSQQQQRRGLNPLDSFFPFDPCLLSQVHELVREGYVSWEGIRGLDYFPAASSCNTFLGEGQRQRGGEEEDEDNDDLVSSVASSITALSLTHSHGQSYGQSSYGQSYGAAMSMGGGSFQAASSLASTCSSGGNHSNNHHTSHGHGQQVSFEQQGEGDGVSSSPYNIRILEKRSRQYSVGSAGSW